MKPKIEDVAKLAGVSPTTVSRVLNNRGYISNETRDKVQKAMNELNYFPNDVARTLFNKRSNLIGLILPTTSNPFFGELTFHLENICASLGYKVLLCNSLNQIDKEEKYLEMLLRNQVDGIIVGTHNRGILDYHKQGLAVVAIDRYLSETIPVVSSDNYEGGKMATDLLIEDGCKCIALIDGVGELETPARLRRKAYVDLMEECGRVPIIYEIPEVFDKKSQQDVISRLFHECPEVDGVFATNDIFAASFINEATSRGKNVPGDVKVVGYDGTETAQILLPQLTTIKQPIELIAKTAIDILLKEIEREFTDFPLETRLPVKLSKGTSA
ncbi:LacI family DNA-binding transcriptional regulator [Heyndrickxia sporothermodurans]|uniref:LacI family DNA-binding transcriptional regulator n=1 Tax=Heyndrickxia sporothermodurans TaxID=46224 RepID=A0AB37HMR4_9BACI|nr:LacI family DNA-binding transcriptional regulator [Heyndrickxia sporothermodurans]MBL5768112.1 LacI family DNA-binding transcriptional regulator [Heyndrickxia sporothermodurans]MBL5771765.1 LacI family DNA-binding transcriptional regulator [Heyndrickxia sporothermodurans]MBL5775411.1 LacI family DNA-binding transcriptional regulator [Heyndrickxia sporothermodurans]MBL5778875.1 LacI family DNA-binding transcriptional regulator [Heyndrickxia sporothermodurans]MBL5782276.1 LacI family DNA-bind